MITDLRLPLYRDVAPSFLVIPMISHWILPAAIEMSLYVKILGIPFYLINLCYVLYVISYPYFGNNDKCNLKVQFWTKYLCLLMCLVCLLTSLWNNSEPLLPILFNAYPIIWLVPIMILCPLSDNQIQSTKYIMTLTLVFLCAEIFLYATGTLTYRSASTNVILVGQEYAGGIMRISTTIGAATGTAIIIAWLGALCISIYNFPSLIRCILYLLTTIAIFYTVSRGTIIVWIAYSLYCLYKYYLRYSSIKVKVISIVLTVAVVLGLNHFSIFDAVLDRNQQLTGNTTTGRDAHIERSVKIIRDSKYLGVGASMMFPEKSIQEVVIPQKREAAHNVYLIVIGELGIIGLLVFVGIIVTMLTNVSNSNPLMIFIWLTLLVNFNTEGVVLMSEFMALFIFMLMVIQKHT